MMAVDGLRNADGRAEYAASKNVPMPELATNALFLGGVGVSLWRAPALAASTVATFSLGVTPAMHDFWTVDDPRQRQQETTHFRKNATPSRNRPVAVRSRGGSGVVGRRFRSVSRLGGLLPH